MKITRSIASITVASLALSSCTTVNPNTGQKQPSKLVKGGVLGALGGAAIGALSGNNRTGGKSRDHAIKGAAIGALAGMGIGGYMDRQESKMRQGMSGSGVTVTRAGNDLILNMPSDITFGSGSSSIQPQFQDTLGSVAGVLSQYNKTQISITGHTDSDGSSSYNQGLSINRARSVANALNSQGVSSSRTQTYGEGEALPIASNNTSAGKAQNRRVVIRIIPQQSQFR